MARDDISRPVRLALACNVINPATTVFDYGCGRGGDVLRLAELGLTVAGWDPAHRPNTPKTPADVVNLGFVVNVIEDVVERRRTLIEAWRLAQRVLLISARLTHERDTAHVARHGDGWATAKGTFQKFYTQDELRTWIERALETDATPAAMGTFFIFRDSRDRQLFESARLRSYSTLAHYERSSRLYTEHEDLFTVYEDFIAERGRPPVVREDDECDQLSRLVGSHTRVMNTILSVRGLPWWDEVTLARRKDLYVQLALEAFRGRQRFGAMADTIQRDIKALAGTYKAACQQADQLLVAVGSERAREVAIKVCRVGKLTGNALYLHVSAIAEAPVLLRMYEACARQLTGEITGNVIKFWRGDPGISYLSYPDFDQEAHPVLAQSTVVDLRNRSVRVADFSNRSNPPILHRKEEFLSEHDPRRTPWKALTTEEEAAGLYADASRIGTRAAWEEALARAGVRIEGHTLYRATGRGRGLTG